MGYENHFTGAITITPPLTWAEIRNGPGVSDVSVRIVEETVDTDTGQNKVLTGDAIVPLSMGRYSGYSVTEDIQAIVDHYAPLGHSFAGHIEMQPDPGFEDQRPSRYVVRARRVEEIRARLVSDDEPDVPAGPAPKRMHADELAALLTDMAARVPVGDSFGGHISYEIADASAHEFDVTGMYRIGNRMGQGGMRIIEGDAPTNDKQGA